MAENIFINYRREDAEASAGRLFDQLERVFGRERIFFDVDSIPPGRDFFEELSAKVAECDVFLAVIGKGWLDVKDRKGSRRIDNATDWVRIELEAALQQGKHVIPVLVNGANMPHPEDLPQSLTAVARRNAVRLAHDRFGSDVQGLIAAVGKLRKAWRAEAERKLALQRGEERRGAEAEAARRAAEEEEERLRAEQARREKQEAERAEAERKLALQRGEERRGQRRKPRGEQPKKKKAAKLSEP